MPFTIPQLTLFAGDHLLLVLGIVGVTIAFIVNEMSRFARGYHTISPAQLTALINRENALVVDVSAPAEYEKGHVVGSKHVAMSQFDPENKQLAKVKDLPVAIICRTGNTSADAAKRLVKAGFKHVHWLDGGINAWQQANFPLEKGRSG